MIKFIMDELSFFRKAFPREKNFLWFCIVIIGFICAQDQIGGISPIIRALGLGNTAYCSIINFFGSANHFFTSLSLMILQWIQEKFATNVVTIEGRQVFILDGKKIPKQGKHMPGNKWQHQESNSNSKPEYFTGQFFEIVGILVQSCLGVMLLPFVVKMIDGYKLHNRDKTTLKDRSANLLQSLSLGSGIVVADAWYAAAVFFQTIIASGATLVTRVAKNAVAYMLPEDVSSQKRGRPKKYGGRLLLFSLFIPGLMTEIVVKGVDGGSKTISFWTKDLLWRPVGRVMRFVGCQMDGNKIILASSDLTLAAESIIQAYVFRSAIEITFWYSTQFLFNWCYRFWTTLKCVTDAGKKTCNLHLASHADRTKFWQKVREYECFLLIGFFVHALLLYLIEKKANLLASSGRASWFRTKRNSSFSLLSSRSIIFSAYCNFYAGKEKASASTKFLNDQIAKAQSESRVRLKKAA